MNYTLAPVRFARAFCSGVLSQLETQEQPSTGRVRGSRRWSKRIYRTKQHTARDTTGAESGDGNSFNEMPAVR